jgi:hypothetical protein
VVSGAAAAVEHFCERSAGLHCATVPEVIASLLPSSDYGYFYDVDGSGVILADDFSEVKKRFFQTLPAPEPAAPAAAFGASLIRPGHTPRRAAALLG